MRMRGGGFGVALLAGLILLFPGVAGAGVGSATITADLSCCNFALELYSQDRGQITTFVNPDDADAPHNVVSTVRGPDGGPLFRSETIAAGSTSPVDGTHTFFCRIHPLMRGAIRVVPKSP